MKKLVLLLSISVYSLSLQAQTKSLEQEECGSSKSQKLYYKNHPGLKENIEASRKEFVNNPNFKSPTGIIIPTVVHILHDGGLENIPDDQVLECIAQLNEDYNGLNPGFGDIIPEFEAIKANVGITFALAKFDPMGNPTTGIDRHYAPGSSTICNGCQGGEVAQYGWPQDQYLNIYVIRAADNGGDAGSAWANTYQGTFSSFWAVGRTRYATPTHYKLITHELGHYFSLAHTFSGGCDDGDGIDDTPPCTTGSGCNLYDYPCSELANRQNYMDYGNCTEMFTEDQKTAMMNMTNIYYDDVISDLNLSATGITGVPIRAQFRGDFPMTVPGDSIIFTDYSETETGTIDSWMWSFPGGTPSSYIGQTPPAIVYENEGSYNITLTVTNSDGQSDSQTYLQYVSVQTDVYMQTADLSIAEGMFYDPGYKGRYGNRTDATLTLRPVTSGKTMQVSFNSFKLENNCMHDWLEIYDGPDVNSTLINKYCALDNPGTVTSSHESGALTFVFHSDVAYRSDGWEADIFEVDTIPVKPTANFRSDKKIICVGDSIVFDDRSSGLPDVWNWTFEGGTPATSTEENPTIDYHNPGTYQVTLEASNTLGSDTKTITKYISVGVGQPLPFAEDFEGDFPPNGWVIKNYDDGIQWSKRTDVGRNSSSCMVMNNADNSVKGELDEISSMGIDFSNWSGSYTMTFDLAYTKYDDESEDVLAILVSTDCWETWREEYIQNHVGLETVNVPTSESNAWIPYANNDWRTETIDLSAYAGEKYVQIKFHNISGYGSRIWIDNVNIGYVGVEEHIKEIVKVYPNPSKGIFNVEIPLGEKVVYYTVYNLSGQIVKQGGSLKERQSLIDLSKEAKGVYLLSIITENKSAIQKLIIE